MNARFQSGGRPVGTMRLACALLLLILSAALLSPLESSADATPMVGSITVNTTDDELNDDGDCSLREAVQAANNDTEVDACPAGDGADIITFAVGSTLPIGTEIYINTNISLVGPIILQNDDAGTSLLRVTTNGTLNITDLTIQNGDRGAVKNVQGTLNILGVSFQNNTNTGDCGAIDNSGDLNILMSTFAGNQAGSGDDGHMGGAICLAGSDSVHISLSNFNGNIASGSGGAIAVTSTSTDVEISDSIFSGNIALGEDPNYHGGGAISNNTDNLDIIRCAFNGNLSPNSGGGALYNKIGTSKVLSVEDSSFNGNIAGSLTDGWGGAILNFGKLQVTRSTFNGNIASPLGKGGAMYSGKQGDVEIANSTFFANNATPAGQGGGIYNADNGSSSNIEVRLYNVTLTDNVAGTGGALYNDNETVELYNTIIDQGGLGAGGTCAGDAPVDGGGNMQSPGTDCGAGIPSVADTMLGAPTYNGGAIVSLLTIMPDAGSPVIDAADNTTCLAAPVNGEDQRAESRPNDGDGDGNPVCDVGAMEREAAAAGYGSDPVQPGPIEFGSAIINTTIGTSFEVFETGNTTLNVSSPTLSGPHAGDFTAPLGFSIADGANPVDVSLDCTPTGVGTRTATLTFSTNDFDHPTVDYTLICIGTDVPEPGYGSTPPAPGPLDFGEVEVGGSRQRSISVFEAGTDSLTVQSPLLGGANPGIFNLQTAFPFTIPDGGSPVDVDLTCQPSEPGIQTAVLTLQTNDPHNPSVSYNLSCDAYISPGPPIVPGPITTASTPYDVAVSPDGKHLYVTSQANSRLLVYERDANGDLTLVQSYFEADLSAPYGVAISPDGLHVFVTSIGHSALHILSRDPEFGTVTTLDVIHDGDLVWCSPDPPYLCLYVDGLDAPDGIAVSPDGRNIYVASTGDNAVSIFRREVPTGTVTYRHRVKEGVGSVVGLQEAKDVAVSPDGSHVYVAASDSNEPGSDGALTVFSRDPESGWLTYVESYPDTGAFLLGGASSVAVSPDGAQVYAASSQDGSLTVLTRNPADGTLTWKHVWFNLFGFVGLDGAHGVATSPDGSFVYVCSVGDNALLAFERDPVDDFLDFRTIYRDGVDGVDGLWYAARVAASPDNRHVYVTGYLDNAVTRFDVANPVPYLISLDPGSATAGDPSFELTVIGQRFSPNSVVQWNGINSKPTTYVSSTELRAEIDAADIAAAGISPVQVYTPLPGGGTSNVLDFTIGQPGDNPVPTLYHLNPAGAMAGDPALTLTLQGVNFVDGAVVQWNGSDRATTYINSEQLQILVPSADLADPGTASVAVENPAPGGGTSNALPFDIAGPGDNPMPSLRRIAPAQVYLTGAGGSDLLVDVYGDNFIPGSQVYLEGQPHITSYVDSGHLQAIFTAGDTAFTGNYAVTVFSPEPGGGTSNGLSFKVVGNRIFLPVMLKG